MRESNRKTLAAAALLGASSGMRTFTPLAVLATRRRAPASLLVRRAVLIAAGSELVADKLPFAPARTMPASYLGRIASAAFCGHAVAGYPGAARGAAAGAVTTQLGYRARRAASASLRAAVLEDAVAIAAANLGLLLSAG